MVVRKIMSKKGYIFTYEAIIVAFIFLSIFYLGYMVYSHNMLTALEEKKDIGKFHKAVLIKDYFLRSNEFPGKFYNTTYLTNFADKLNLKEKTFDLFNNFSKYNGTIRFIIHSNRYDEELTSAYDDLHNYDKLNNLTYIFDNNSSFTVYSNVYSGTPEVNLTINGENVVSFMENLYVPKISGILDSDIVHLYGCSGDHIYFKVDSKIISASARVITNNLNPFTNWQSWNYATPILIVNNLDEQLPNYDVKIVFNSQNYIEAGEMRPDCGDVRFVDENGNPLSYWIEPNTIDTSHTVAWVKVNLAPNEHKLIYMLYGNPTATTTANGDDTFLFFDDFSNGKLDNTKWVFNFNDPLFINSTYSNGLNFTYLSLDYDHYNNGQDDVHITSLKTFYPNTALRFYANFHKRYEEWGGYYENIGGYDYNREVITNYHWGGEWLRVESSVLNQDDDSYIVLQDPNLYDHWITYEIQRNGSSSVNFIINDTIYKTIYSNIYSGDLPISFYARKYDSSTTYGYYPVPSDEQNGNISIDWIFVRPYVEPEPKVTLLSSDVIFTVNGYVYKKPLTSLLNKVDITPNLKEGINCIRILNSPLPVEFSIETENVGNIYYLTLSPKNVTIMVSS